MKHVSKSWDNPSRKTGETANTFFVDFVYETFLGTNLGGGFKKKITLTWENHPIWLIFFRWVETTN